MTRSLSAVLAADGSSDRTLVPVLRWLLAAHGAPEAQVDFAEPALLGQRHGLVERIRLALDSFPSDLLFVHRDAEGQAPEARVEEIARAISEIQSVPPYVCVVPVRMTEAWLLFDERALRYAAGNPNGRAPLELPRMRDVDRLPDPKAVLHRALLAASERSGRRRDKFRISRAVHHLADRIEDFAPLRAVPAFCSLEAEVAAVVEAARGHDA